MIASHNSAKLWKWNDYTTGDSWLVATTWWGFVLLAFVGIWLSFSAKYIKQILANFALWFHWHIRSDNVRLSQGGASTERSPLLGLRESSAERARRQGAEKDRAEAKVLAKVYRDKNGLRDLVRELFFNKALKSSPKYRWRLFGFIIFVSVISAGFIISGVSLAWLKSNGPALLDSKKCGLWVFDRERGGEEAATRAGLNDLEKETRAGEYAHNCYGTPDPFDATQCNFLYRRRLALSQRKYTTDCPFQNEICGQNQTVTFTSDAIDASDLGINSEKSPKFRRSTSCTPLSMDYPFIQNETRDGVTTYYYYYGQKHPSNGPPINYTYKTIGDPFDRHAPAYDVFAYVTNTTDFVESYWKPRPELTYPEFSTLTLIFVSSLRIVYKKGSDDPIFPADEKILLPDEEKPWFRNSDPRARPLACIDSIDVCLGDGKTCWPMNSHIPKDTSGNWVETPPEFWLMYASLLKTDVYNSIEKRLGRGLLAQKLVSQYFSEALGDYHWVDEVENFVATLLARTQINAWSIASGEDSVHEGKDRYMEITKGLGELCGIFKYNPPGYVSIHFWRFILALLSYPICWILSLKLALTSRGSTTSDVAELISELAEAQDVEHEQPANQGPDTPPTRPETEDTAGVAGHRRLSSVSVSPNYGDEGSQGGVDTQPLDSSAAGNRSPPRSGGSHDNREGQHASRSIEEMVTEPPTEEETTETGRVAEQQDRGTAGSTSMCTAGTTSGVQDPHESSQEQPSSRRDERAMSQNSATEITRTMNNDSDVVEWKPLLINNIFELIYCLIRRRPIKPAFELWQEGNTVD